LKQTNQLNVTRGHGLLEPFLARLRANKANQLIHSHLRSGKILDVGCGSYPYFLSHTMFASKFSIDQQEPIVDFKDINWVVLDLNQNPQIPFEDSFFDVITLLAVIEHLDPTMITDLFNEIYRVLKPEGLLIITTPAHWTNGLLYVMSKIKLVSKEEIEEHKFTYTLPLIGWFFGKAGFSMEKVKFGYFEFFMNLWGIAQK
jgi:SAM-dependent methyltransferase